MATDIFISYRRDGGREIARTVYLALGKLGYQNIFFDFNSIRDGIFNTQIIDAINTCKDFILILSEGSMNRCVNEDDWVRKEISTAIEAKCNLIPVKIDNINVTFPDGFPKNLNKLKDIQFSTLMTNEFFDDSIKRISKRLSSKPVEIKEQIHEQKQDSFVLTIFPDETCEFFIDKERISKIKGGKFLRQTQLTPGRKYLFEFKSLASKNLLISVNYNAPTVKKTDELSISFAEYKNKLKIEQLRQIENAKKEREAKKLQKDSFRMMLKDYDKYDIEAYDGMTLVYKDGLYGYLDKQGLEVISCDYNNALHFSEGLACVYDSSKWVYIDTYGNLTGIVSDTPSYKTNKRIIISEGGKYGIVDSEGNRIIDLIYDDILLPSNNIYAGRLGSQFVFFNLQGELVNPLKFDSITVEFVGIGIDGNVAEHYYNKEAEESDFLKKIVLPAFVKKNKRYGKIDINGRQIIPCVADELFEMGPNIVHAILNGKNGLFNSSTGQVVVPLIYKCFAIIGDERFIYLPHDVFEMSGDHKCFNFDQPYIKFFSSLCFLFNGCPLRFIVSKDTPCVVENKGFRQRLPYTEKGTLGMLSQNGECIIPLEYNYISFIYGFSYFAILIIQKEEDVDIARFFQLMDYIEKETAYFRGENKKFIEDSDDYKEYKTLMNKIHFRKDVYHQNISNQNQFQLTSRYDCDRGIVKIVFEHNDEQEQSENDEICELKKEELHKELIITDHYSSKDFDKIESTIRSDISFVYKNGRCGIYDNNQRRLLSNISFDVLKLSEMESGTVKKECCFNFAKNGMRGIFDLFIAEDGRVFYDDSLLKFVYKEEEIKAIFED